MNLDGSLSWIRLAHTLCDWAACEESLDAMQRLERSAPDSRFTAPVWQGHLFDIPGRRQEALSRYQDALRLP
jgi:hypothetical protein